MGYCLDTKVGQSTTPTPWRETAWKQGRTILAVYTVKKLTAAFGTPVRGRHHLKRAWGHKKLAATVRRRITINYRSNFFPDIPLFS